jgi:hypothetical protein
VSVYGAFRALKEMGVTEEDFRTLNDFVRSRGHEAHKGGQHTNGGCRDGRCDYGSPECRAWTAMCEAIARWAR